MRRSYDFTEPSEAAQAMGKKLADALVAGNVSYRDALAALNEAERLLMAETKPVNI